MGVTALKRSAVALLVGVGMVACSTGPADDDPAPPTESAPATTAPDMTRSYVAFGDSFTAGPGIQPQQPDDGQCQRSKLNWPSLLAADFGVDTFIDRSCSGATSSDVLATVKNSPLDGNTDLVTVGIGGNDGGFFLSLISECSVEGPQCEQFVRDEMRPILEQTVSSIGTVIQEVRTRAPKAQVLLVGYLRIMPRTGTCPAVGVPAGQADLVSGAESALDDALRAAADESGIEYVSMWDGSAAHDACSAELDGDLDWVNGAAVSDGDGIIFHPRRAGMQGVANEVRPRIALGSR